MAKKSKVHPAAKGVKLSKGFKRHDGGPAPVPLGAFVRMAILTADDGVLVTEPQRAKLHEWEHDKHDAGIGAVVGYEQPK